MLNLQEKIPVQKYQSSHFDITEKFTSFSIFNFNLFDKE